MKKSVLLNCCVALLLGSPIIKAQTPCELLTTVSPNTPICAGTHVTLEVATKGINLGTGVDGDLSINSTFFTDVIKSAVVGANISGTNKIRVANVIGFSIGDEVLAITMQDANALSNLVGKHEFLTISSISLDTLMFTQNISNSYISTLGLKHQLVKVPQFNNVTVNNGGNLTCSAWNGIVGGVVCFKALGAVTVNAGGSINANGNGYRGVTQKTALWRDADGGQGEGIYGTGIASGLNGGSLSDNFGSWLSANGNGGGGGTGTGDAGGGGGGGNADAGTVGVNFGHTSGSGGLAVGNSSLTVLIMGGAGGEGGADEDGAFPGAGGNGGGIISIATNSLYVFGTISSDGNIGNDGSNEFPGSGCGTTAGGGGAGGSISIATNNFFGPMTSHISAIGGFGGHSKGLCDSLTGGLGGNGRIRVDIPGALPSTNPVAYHGTNSVVSGVSYLWSNGDTSFSSIVAPSVTTSYTVTMSSISGCTGSSSVVVVNVNPTPIITVNSGAICEGNSFTMIPSGASTYTFSSGLSVVTPVENTSYSVSGTDINGCVSSVMAISDVTVHALPIITVNSGAICEGNSFTMIPSGASTYTFSSGSAIVIPMYSTSYSVIGSDLNGCVSSVMAVSEVTVNTLPIITVNSGAICEGNSFTMIPSGASTYTFSSGSAIVSPITSTSYSVSGTDLNGCENHVAAVSEVTVNALPLITVNSGAVCEGNSFTMIPSGASTYTFSSGSAIVTPISTTSYSVSGTDINGCVSSVMAVSGVTVNALPLITVNSGAVCEGNSFTMIPTGANTYTFSSGSAIVTPISTTSYSVSGTDLNGCLSSVIAVSEVTVNALPLITVNSGAVCEGNSFTMIPSGANTYTFSGGSAIVSPISTTSYSVSGTDLNGCENHIIAVSEVTVNALPLITVNSGAICEGNSFTMIPSGASTYTFSSGSSLVTPTATSTYSVSGTDINGCVSSIVALSEVKVNALPILIVTTDNTVICAGQTAMLTVSGASTYTWNTAETTNTISITPLVATTYTVNGTGFNGCSNSITITQNVSICTVINDLNSNSSLLIIYPNPSNGLYNFDLEETSQIIITNTLGQVILSETMNVGKQNFDISSQANGVYFVNVKQNGKQQTIKLIKE
jgi:hypothetical protein